MKFTKLNVYFLLIRYNKEKFIAMTLILKELKRWYHLEIKKSIAHSFYDHVSCDGWIWNYHSSAAILCGRTWSITTRTWAINGSLFIYAISLRSDVGADF